MIVLLTLVTSNSRVKTCSQHDKKTGKYLAWYSTGVPAEAGWIQPDPAMQVPRGHPVQQQYSSGTAHGQLTVLLSRGSGKRAPVSAETNMDGQLPGGHPSQQQYPSPKQGKSISGTATGFCAGSLAPGAVGTATTVWFSAKERRMDCWSPGWLARKAKESACRGTGFGAIAHRVGRFCLLCFGVEVALGEDGSDHVRGSVLRNGLLDVRGGLFDRCVDGSFWLCWKALRIVRSVPVITKQSRIMALHPYIFLASPF